MSQASSTQTSPEQALPARRRHPEEFRMPGENLTIEETLRVMDVARELRERRETAEVMFRRDGVRAELREKLLRQARISGDKVTEVEIDAAIDQYLATLNTYQDPPPGWKRWLALAWVHRGRILAGLAAVAAVAAVSGFRLLVG